VKTRFALPALFAALVITIPAVAHHSFSAEFDGSKPIQLQGTVTKLEWANPHTFFYIDVKDASGKTANWACETNGPNGLIRAGWKRNSLKIGDQVTVDGYRAKDGSNMIDARLVKLPDGRKVFAGNSDDGGPKK
jgi:hypothetical protein